MKINDKIKHLTEARIKEEGALISQATLITLVRNNLAYWDKKLWPVLALNGKTLASGVHDILLSAGVAVSLDTVRKTISRVRGEK